MAKDGKPRSPDRSEKSQIDSENKKTLDLCEDGNEDLCQESRCPICLDHPHNSILLICSSHKNGCRPFMCDNGEMLSDCFTHFCKLHSVVPSDSGCFVGNEEAGRRRVFGCPLCRGEIKGWIVVDSARRSMNELVRNCSVDCCDYSGNFTDLMKHAESQHPETRPRDEVAEVAEVAEADEFDWADWDEGDFDDFENLLLQHFDAALDDPDWEEGEHVDIDELWEEGEHVDIDELYYDPYHLQDVDFNDWEEINQGMRLESLLDSIQFD